MSTPDKIQYRGAMYVREDRILRIAKANGQLREALWPFKKKDEPLPDIPSVKTILPENRDAPQRTLAEVPLDIAARLATKGVLYAFASQNILTTIPDDERDIEEAMKIVIPRMQERAAPEVPVEELQPDIVPQRARASVNAAAPPKKMPTIRKCKSNESKDGKEWCAFDSRGNLINSYSSKKEALEKGPKDLEHRMKMDPRKKASTAPEKIIYKNATYVRID